MTCWQAPVTFSAMPAEIWAIDAGVRVAGGVLGDLVHHAGERLRQARHVGSQARDLHLHLLERLFGLRRVCAGKDKLPIKLVEIGEQARRSAASRARRRPGSVRLEIGLDRAPGTSGRRIARPCAATSSPGRSPPGCRSPSWFSALVPALSASCFALSRRGVRPRRRFGRSRVSAVSSRTDSKISLIGEVGAEAALSSTYFGLSASSGLQLQIVERHVPRGDEILAVELEDVGKQAHILLLDGGLVARRAQAPSSPSAACRRSSACGREARSMKPS